MTTAGRLALLIAYDGEEFHGWQVQPDAVTVQGTLERALSGLLDREVQVKGAGRTDAGVHALGQVAHLPEPEGWPVERLRAALNARLPPAIRVLAARRVPAGFHALHSAVAKTYLYQLHRSTEAGGERAIVRSVPPHRRRVFHAVRGEIDLGAMRRGAALLRGRHDFTTLSKAMPPGRGTVKTLEALRILRIPSGLRVIVTGDGFLYGMVRLMVGLLVDVGCGRRSPESIPDLLAARDRSLAPASLPGGALFLWRVHYPLEALGGGNSSSRRATLRPAILDPTRRRAGSCSAGP